MQLCRQIIFSLTLLQGLLLASAQNFSNYHIELDPDTDSANITCNATFSALLTTQVGIWFVDAVASETGSYPPVTNVSGLVKNTVRQGQKINDRMLIGDQSPSEEQGERDLYSCCSGCCYASSWCNTYCSGACLLCRRNLRSGSSRMLDGHRNDWFVNSDQDRVASNIQFAARRWLKQNDENRCMGHPWKLEVHVNYF